MAPDLAALAWIQSRLIFYVGGTHGYDPNDPMRPAEALVLFDFYKNLVTARHALDGIGSTTASARAAHTTYRLRACQRDERGALGDTPEASVR
jgi:hypothetical protein